MKLLALASLGLLTACGGEPPTPTSVCRGSSPILAANGIEGANGKEAQGIEYQGIDFQGVNMQGINMQGMETQGTSLQLVGTTLMLLGDRGRLGPAGIKDAKLTAILRSGKPVELSFTGSTEEHGLTYYTLVTDRGTNICGPGGKGMFVAGVWDERGGRHDSLGSGDTYTDVTFSCTTGVIAKCVKWGYQPWSAGPELHQTCTRMARADYCGDGVAHTQNGTLVDIFDVHGIQEPVMGNLTFEAGWGPDGAVCVQHPRYADQVPSCWSAKPTCASFEEAVEEHGAEIGNESLGVRQGSLCVE